MIIFSTILMICGAIAAVNGYASIVAIHLDTIDGLFEIGLIALIVGFVMLMVTLSKSRKNQTVIVQKCPYCNELVNQNATYCHNCGKKIS